MATKIILFAAVFGIIVVVGKSQSYDILCSEIKGDECLTDADCKCSGSRFICNRFSRCDRMTLKDIMARQPCNGIFKGECSTDLDCFCKGDKLVCEGNECVKAKSVNVF